jgi:hypothetical protein
MNTNIDNNNLDIEIQQTSSQLSLANRWDHFLKRLGINRSRNRVKPGLYTLGNPNPKSQIFVSANYTLSFKLSRLADVTERKTIILPQLGAPGVAAHKVKKLSGFNVEYGPVRANDLPVYLKTHKATPEMRRVNFNLGDRLILVPTETVQALILIVILAAPLYFIGGPLPAIAVTAAFLGGVVLFPILLKWIPTPHFSTKGFILGVLIALPFVLIEYFGNPGTVLWQRAGRALAYILILAPVTAFLSLNFTGATTFTSKSGVKREIFAYIPKMAWVAGTGIVLSLAFVIINLLGA